MADVPTPSRRVLPWALASFHAATLVVVPVGLAYAVDPRAVGGLLAGLDTLVGLGFYLVLWASVLVTNRRWLAATSLADGRAAVRGGARWGALTGLPLLLALVVVVAVLVNPVFAGLLLLVGAVVAPLVGAAVGAVFAALDVALYRLAGHVAPRAADVPGVDDPTD